MGLPKEYDYEEDQSFYDFNDDPFDNELDNVDHRKRIRRLLEDRLERKRLKQELDDELEGEFDWDDEAF